VPTAVTDCLNFGSPEDPGVMWQFREALHGIADGCQELGIPVIGGNVSFYNSTGGTAILPTPLVGVLGVIDDVRHRVPTGIGAVPGEMLFLLGDTRDEFGGSEWAHEVHGHLGGRPPEVDLAAERRLAGVLLGGSRAGLVSATHDLSDGGLAQAVVEAALIGRTGCRITLPEDADPFVWLFAESAGRALVAVPGAEVTRFTELCAEGGVPCCRIGAVDAESEAVAIEGVATIPLTELAAAWERTLPALFD
jgi:phosphoribosylformylglycinamidine synthase